jgi:beta-lactam-binding protein with PASTA domain
VNKTEIAAKAELEAAGFTVVVRDGQTFAPGDPNIGKVLQQDPGPADGLKPADKTTVTIFVGRANTTPT